MGMKYAISIPIGAASAFDACCDENEFNAHCFSAGCGTAEYEFHTKKDRDQAVKVFLEGLVTKIDYPDDKKPL